MRHLLGPIAPFVSALLLLGITGCVPQHKPVPSGIIPEGRALNSSDEQYANEVAAQFTQRFPLDNDLDRYNRVRTVLDRIVKKTPMGGRDPWKLFIYKDAEFKNAAATRGNAVFVWTGILDSIKSDDELAGIIAHEIGHVLARHTDPSPAEEAARVLGAALGQTTRAIISSQSAYGGLAGLAGVIVQGTVDAFAVNPLSKSKELEADDIGFFLAADAGYDPRKIIEFWERAEGDPGLQSSPLEFFSTHPSSSERIVALLEKLPRAMERFEKRGYKPTTIKNTSETTESFENRKTLKFLTIRRRIPIFREASGKSEVIGDLRPNSEVEAIHYRGKWYKIPKSGYIHRADLLDLP